MRSCNWVVFITTNSPPLSLLTIVSSGWFHNSFTALYSLPVRLGLGRCVRLTRFSNSTCTFFRVLSRSSLPLGSAFRPLWKGICGIFTHIGFWFPLLLVFVSPFSLDFSLAVSTGVRVDFVIAALHCGVYANAATSV